MTALDALHDSGVGYSIQKMVVRMVHAQDFQRFGAHSVGELRERLLNVAADHDAWISAFCKIMNQKSGILIRTSSTNGQLMHLLCQHRVGTRWIRIICLKCSRNRFTVLQSFPFLFRGCYRHAARTALQERHDAPIVGDVQTKTRAWKLLTLLPFMLLRRVP